MAAVTGGRASASPAPDAGFAERLIRWHHQNGRHDLPWQQQPTPYRVWVSEVMLQQTQVATVIDYFQRFMARFPDVVALAQADQDEVLHLWSGLGYYSRARNLHKAAQRIKQDFGGALPTEQSQLMELPGIGRSTAAAIVALSANRRATILDGNVKRVLTRYFALAGAPGTAAFDKALWTLAEACTPHDDVAVYTQAIMDLGATLCTRRQPQCQRCPQAQHCAAHARGQEEHFPVARRRAERRARSVVLLLLQRADGCVLLRRRPPQGVWAGLWVPPEFESVTAAMDHVARQYGDAAQPAPATAPALWPAFRHVFTHFDLDIQPLHLRLGVGPMPIAVPGIMDDPDLLWYNPKAPARIGLPAPISTLLERLPSS